MPLGDLVEVLDHRRVPVNRKERASRPGKVPYYGATGQVDTIDQALFDEPLVLLGEDGIQFFNRRAQKAYLIDGPAWVNNHAHVLRPIKNLVDRRYLRHALNNADYAGLANGTTRLKLTQRAMLGMQIPVPPRREQDRIVRILDQAQGTIDDVRAALQTAAELGRGLEASLVRQAFEANAATQPLDAVATIQSGIAKGRPGDGPLAEVPYLSTANVQAGRLALDTVKTISVTADQRSKHALRHGDVLVVEGGDPDKVGRGWIWESQIPECLHQNHVFAVRPQANRLLPEYLASFVNAPQARAYFFAAAKQTTNLASINKRQLRALPVPLPSLNDQRAIVAKVVAAKKIAASVTSDVDARLRELDQLWQSMLHRSLTGELTAAATEARTLAALPPAELIDATGPLDAAATT